MEKTEIMKRYEDETGKHSVILKFMAGGQALESKDFPKIGPYDYSTDYIAWLEAKANISDEAIEAFQEIIRNQCDEITALKEKAEAYDRLMSGNPTPKEIANVLGMVIAQNPNNTWETFDKKNGLDITHCNIRYNDACGNSLTLPDGWETKGENK